MLPQYKATRKPSPEEFKVQVPLLQELLRLMGYPLLIQTGVEADDVMASLALRATEKGWQAVLLSSDKDLMQVLGPGVLIMRPLKSGVSSAEIYSAADFEAEKGFSPSSVPDYLALLGDKADNVPGVAGIGEKTAGELISRWPTLEGVFDGLSEAAGREITVETSLEELRAVADEREVEYDPKWNAGKLSLELFGDLVEPGLIQPTFVHDYPSLAQPLARPHRSEPGKIEAWDLIIGGMERGTGFTELIDPVIQRDVLVRQSLAAAAGDPEAMQLDEDFLEALEYGAPPMGGMGLGIDRLVMLLNPGAGIRETILYPLLRPSAG